MYVIKKGKFYVNHPGSGCSYTNDIRKAIKFKTREDAERERCPENEYVVNVYDEIR